MNEPAATSLRAATAGDRPAIVDLCKRSLVATYGGFMDPEKMRPWVEGREVETYVDQTWPHMTVAVRGETVVGVVALDREVIDLVWVRDELRGQGIGAHLMDAAERALAAGHDEAELECFAPNVGGLRFYRARGYREVRRYWEQASGVDKVVLRKPLARPVTLERVERPAAREGWR